MITAALLAVVVSLVVVPLLSAFPHVDAPSWLTDISGPLGTVMQGAASMSVWWPIGLTGTVAAAVFGAWLLGFGIKLARIVASYLTLGGGSAG